MGKLACALFCSCLALAQTSHNATYIWGRPICSTAANPVDANALVWDGVVNNCWRPLTMAAGLAIACSANPGDTIGLYRQQCQTAAGVVYACNNGAGCSVAADWVSIGLGVTKVSSTVTLGPIMDGNCAETPPFNLAGVNPGDTVFAGTTSANLPASVTVTAKVVAANVVAIDICNLSGATYTVSSATFTVAVSK
jgi:hypothetical protein